MIQAQLVLRELKRCGATHVIGLPDNSSASLFALLARDNTLRILTVTREGEAFALASGIWIGGKVPVVLIQNTGLLESGDGYRGTALRMRVPLLCLVTYRGYGKLRRLSRAGEGVLPVEEYSRPDLDSAAIFTEPTLRAWGLPYDLVQEDSDVAKISRAFLRAEAESRPVAVIFTDTLT